MVEISHYSKEVVNICRKIYNNQLVKQGEGNVSIRIPNQNAMIITPSENDYENLSEDNMIHMDFDGVVLQGKLKPSSEHIMHCYIYRKRPKVNCIIHTHSPNVSILSVLHNDLPIIFEEMAMLLGGSVKCSKFAQAGTEELPKVAIKAMKKQNTVILANHGLLVVGRTSEYCVKTAVIIEKMVNIFLNAKKIGDVKVISTDNQKKFIEIFDARYSTY
ncbi:MAG: class II aldolase/adducin family protein [Candidatus Heimdallarchaeota archaeon]